MAELVTFGDFARMARARGWTAEFLASRFRGIIEEPGGFFDRVLKGKPGWDVPVPYRSVLALYREEMARKVPLAPGARPCLCGCGKPVAGRKLYFSSTCRKRMSRRDGSTLEEVTDLQKGVLAGV